MQVSKSELIWRVFIVAFWVRAMWGYTVEVIVPPLRDLEPMMMLAFDAVMVLLGLITMRRRTDVLYAIAFVAVAFVITCVFNDYSFTFYLNGLRDFIGYIFLVPIFHYFQATPERHDTMRRRFDRHLWVFLIIQAVCVTHQFLVFGAGDHGGGSLGNYNSGVITTLIYLISFHLALPRMRGRSYLAGLWHNRWLLFLLFPTFLNETKVSFVFLAMYLLLLLPMDRRIFARTLAAIPLVVLFLVMAMIGYVKSTGDDVKDIFNPEFYTEKYLLNDESEQYAKFLLEEDNGEIEDIPRFTKLLLIGDMSDEHPGHWLTGFGVGHFKGGTVTDQSEFYKEYYWMLYGTVPYLLHMWVQLGVIGLLLMVVFFVIHMLPDRDGFRPDANITIYLILLAIVILFYNESWRNTFMFLIVDYVMIITRHPSPKVTPAEIKHSEPTPSPS